MDTVLLQRVTTKCAKNIVELKSIIETVLDVAEKNNLEQKYLNIIVGWYYMSDGDTEKIKEFMTKGFNNLALKFNDAKATQLLTEIQAQLNVICELLSLDKQSICDSFLNEYEPARIEKAEAIVLAAQSILE